MFYITIDGVRVTGSYFDEHSARNAAERMSNEIRANMDKRVCVMDADDEEVCAFKNGERCE